MPEHFEIVVVGGGKGGKTLAAKRASAGHRVALVEKGMIGGSCINVACIPTKTLVRCAEVAELARRAAGFGLRVTFGGADPIGGFIKVNDRLETTAPGVWALGDVNGGPQFTHVSLDDWRIVAANQAGGAGAPPIGSSPTRSSSIQSSGESE